MTNSGVQEGLVALVTACEGQEVFARAWIRATQHLELGAGTELWPRTKGCFASGVDAVNYGTASFWKPLPGGDEIAKIAFRMSIPGFGSELLEDREANGDENGQDRDDDQQLDH